MDCSHWHAGTVVAGKAWITTLREGGILSIAGHKGGRRQRQGRVDDERHEWRCPSSLACCRLSSGSDGVDTTYVLVTEEYAAESCYSRTRRTWKRRRRRRPDIFPRCSWPGRRTLLSPIPLFPCLSCRRAVSFGVSVGVRPYGTVVWGSMLEKTRGQVSPTHQRRERLGEPTRYCWGKCPSVLSLSSAREASSSWPVRVVPRWLPGPDVVNPQCQGIFFSLAR